MRNYIRTTERGNYPTGHVLRAVQRIIVGKEKLTRVSMEMHIPRRTLQRYCDKKKSLDESDPNGLFQIGYTKTRLVFDADQETQLEQYLVRASDIYFGLTPMDVRKLAHEYSMDLNLKVPDQWTENKCAGQDWLDGFLHRHPSLSIRKPQATSLARATSFNSHNVNLFFDNLIQLMERKGLTAADLWNMDETGVTTVHRPQKIVAKCGRKQVGAVTSGERGVLVTLAVAVSALGLSIPPFFVFPRVNFKSYFLNGSPLGSAGSANKSGWMTESDFLLFMRHFIQHVRPSQERPVLLLLDNHGSHLCLEAIQLAKDNGVLLLSFPPHCSHKLQPLDRSVYGPFKKYFNTAAGAWMRENPGKSMSIYDIPAIVKAALPPATTPSNIMAGFQVAGISPLNRYIFQNDVDFAPSFVTDRPITEKEVSVEILAEVEYIPGTPIDVPFDLLGANIEQMVYDPPPLPGPVDHVPTENPSTPPNPATPAIPVTPPQSSTGSTSASPSPTGSSMAVERQSSPLERIRPFPKAGERKSTSRKSRKRQSAY